nr:carbon-nitrogen hydrolase family protein [uncultured Sphingorhabdus sp.]
MRIAVHQMTSGVHPWENVAAMTRAMTSAGEGGAIMYFAPEMSVMLNRNRGEARPLVTSEAASPFLAPICECARENGMWVHLGSMAVDHEGGKLANRSLLIGPEGDVRARYDKIHLFDVSLASGENWRESSAYAAGTQPIMVDTPLGLMGLAICYDMRFPDLFSAYAKAGVRVLALPSAFTVPTGEAHWHSLLRARAIESGSFVIAAAQCGLHADGRETFGHSLVVDPWGRILLDMGSVPGLAFVDLDLTQIAAVRAQIPVHANRQVISDPLVMG